MEKSAEILEKLAVTLEKYKKNKTMIPPADLAGKYKVPFQKLKDQLKQELTSYLAAYSLEQLTFAQDDKEHLEEFLKDNDLAFRNCNMSRRVGHAAFKEMNLDQVKQLAEELRIKVYEEAWVPYFQKHICLYITEGCLATESNPQTPRIYNSLVDKFWDEETKEWKRDDAAKVPALLMYVQGKENAT